MTVATLIEIGAGGSPGLGQGQVPITGLGRAHSAAQASGALSSRSPATMSGLGSFGSRWQSVLAPLVADLDGLSEKDTGTGEDQTAGLAGLEATAERASSGNSSALGAVILQKDAANIPLMKPREQGTGLAIVGPTRPPATSGTGITAARDAMGANRQAANTHKSAKLQAASADTVTPLAAALPEIIPMETLPQVSAHPAANAPAASVSGVPKQPSPPDPNPVFAGSVGSNPYQPVQSNLDIAAPVAGLTGPAGGHGTEIQPATESAVHNDSAAQDLPGTRVSSAPSGAREIPSAGEEPPAPGDTQAQAERPLRATTQDRNQVQSGLPSQELRVDGAPVSGPAPGPSPTNAGVVLDPSSQPLAATANTGRPGPGGAARTSTQSTLRMTRAAGSFPSVQQGNPLPVEEPGNSVQDGVAPRGTVGTSDAKNAAGDVAETPRAMAAGAVGRETPAALDTGIAPGTPTGVPAGSQRVEAGLESPALAGSSPSSPSLEMTPHTTNPGASVSARISGQGAPRPAHGTVAAESSRQEDRLISGQLGGSAPDGSSLSLDPANTLGAASPVGALAGGSAGAPGGTGSRETFDALDAGTAAGMPTWTHTGAERAEAGFNDPALGWVSVRADTNGAGIHASLVPGSAEAAQVLGGHMAGLNAYLGEHHTPVETLTLAVPESRVGEFSTDTSAGQLMQSGNGQGMGQDTGQGGRADQQVSTDTSPPASATVTITELPAQAELQDRTSQPSTSGGLHISVMA